MLRDRHEPVDLFALVPQLGLDFEPQLAQLDQLLDDDRIFRRVRDDLGRRYPTDGGLIGDGVRVVSRLLRRARSVLGEAASRLGGALRSRARTVRRVAQQLHRIARREGQQGREALEAAYAKSIETAKKTVG